MFLVQTLQEWRSKRIKKLGFDFTEDELANHKDGFIGEKMGMKCYLSEFIESKRVEFNEKNDEYRKTQ
jgi:hypothetical protein